MGSVLNQLPSLRGAGGLYMPMDEKTQLSKGFAFIELASPQVRPPGPHSASSGWLVELGCHREGLADLERACRSPGLAGGPGGS